MNKKIVLSISFLLVSSCLAAMDTKSAIEILHDKFYKKNYVDVKSELQNLNKKEMTPKARIPTPDGGEFNLHKYLWNSEGGVDCILMLYINPESNIIDDVGVSTGAYKNEKASDNAIRERRRIEHEKVCIAGL